MKRNVLQNFLVTSAVIGLLILQVTPHNIMPGSIPPPQMMDEKVYKVLEIPLTQINDECIAMDDFNTKKSVEITLKILEELINQMKKANRLFEWLFNRTTYVGSYFDGLRVKEATEFDINVVLKLPLVYEKIKIERSRKFPGFVKMNLKDAKYAEDKLTWHKNETDEVFKWVNQDGYLSHKSVLQWWERIFSKLRGLTTLRVNSCDYKITAFKKAGPAMTAHISGPGVDIDVDLVPVIQFPRNVTPPQPIRWNKQLINLSEDEKKTNFIRRRFQNRRSSDLLENTSIALEQSMSKVDLSSNEASRKKTKPQMKRRRWVKKPDKADLWYVVPKRRDDDELLWRVSFPTQEKEIMTGLYNLKPVNRFLKRVRDVFNWKLVASYYIKTIFLWEAFEKSKDKTFFNKNLGFLFVYFLGRLQTYLELGNLPFFWDSEMNLFEKIKRTTLENYAGRVKRTKERMERFIVEDKPAELKKLMNTLFYPSGCTSGENDWVMVDNPKHPAMANRQSGKNNHCSLQ